MDSHIRFTHIRYHILIIIYFFNYYLNILLFIILNINIIKFFIYFIYKKMIIAILPSAYIIFSII